MATLATSAVILDTNALRELSEHKLRELLEREAAASVLPIADAWTIMELVAGLVDQSSPRYRAYRNGLRAVCERSLLASRPVIQPFEAQLYRYLFGTEQVQAQENLRWLCETAMHFDRHDEPHRDDALMADVRTIAALVADYESRFTLQISQMSEHLVGWIQSRGGRVGIELRAFLRSEAFVSAEAFAYVASAAATAGRVIPDAERDRIVDEVASAFRPGFVCRGLALERVICDGQKLDRSGNLAWDIEIAHNLSQGVEDRDLLVVSTDGLFSATARNLSKPKAAITLAGYQALLASAQAP